MRRVVPGPELRRRWLWWFLRHLLYRADLLRRGDLLHARAMFARRHPVVRQLQQGNPDLHLLAHVGRLQRRWRLLTGSDADMQHVRLADLHVVVYLGRVLVFVRAGLRTQHHVGLRKLREQDLRRLRTVGRVRRRGRLLAGDHLGLRKLRQPDVLARLYVG